MKSVRKLALNSIVEISIGQEVNTVGTMGITSVEMACAQLDDVTSEKTKSKRSRVEPSKVESRRTKSSRAVGERRQTTKAASKRRERSQRQFSEIRSLDRRRTIIVVRRCTDELRQQYGEVCHGLGETQCRLKDERFAVWVEDNLAL